MKTFKRNVTICIAAAALIRANPVPAVDQGARDAVETLRADIRADRTTMIAEQMQFSQQESDQFWPMYRNYRVEVDKATDEIVKLVLEYSDVYPNVSEDKAREMLERYRKAEAQLFKIKGKYLKSFGKVLPATKVFRFAQLDNRYDLGVRVGIAASVPILGAPIKR